MKNLRSAAILLAVSVFTNVAWALELIPHLIQAKVPNLMSYDRDDAGSPLVDRTGAIFVARYLPSGVGYSPQTVEGFGSGGGRIFDRRLLVSPYVEMVSDLKLGPHESLLVATNWGLRAIDKKTGRDLALFPFETFSRTPISVQVFTYAHQEQRVDLFDPNTAIYRVLKYENGQFAEEHRLSLSLFSNGQFSPTEVTPSLKGDKLAFVSFKDGIRKSRVVNLKLPSGQVLAEINPSQILGVEKAWVQHLLWVSGSDNQLTFVAQNYDDHSSFPYLMSFGDDGGFLFKTQLYYPAEKVYSFGSQIFVQSFGGKPFQAFSRSGVLRYSVTDADIGYKTNNGVTGTAVEHHGIIFVPGNSVVALNAETGSVLARTISSESTDLASPIGVIGDVLFLTRRILKKTNSGNFYEDFAVQYKVKE
jgi:hypothetical protein